MTGFAEAQAENGDHSVRVSIRSVNHRSLDIKIRTSALLGSLESGIRRKVREFVSRGSVQLRIDPSVEGRGATRVDLAFVQSRVDALHEIAALCGAKAQPDPNLLLSLSGSVLTERSEMPASVLEQLVSQALGQALRALDQARAEEAEAMVADIADHAVCIEAEVRGVRDSVDLAVEERHATVQRRIEQLLSTTEVDPARLAQEGAYLASRTDISEELARLEAHLEALRRCFEGSALIGKRIGFLVQEMNREANTLLSKAQALGRAGLGITRAGLRIRGEIDKIREQALNLQ